MGGMNLIDDYEVREPVYITNPHTDYSIFNDSGIKVNKEILKNVVIDTNQRLKMMIQPIGYQSIPIASVTAIVSSFFCIVFAEHTNSIVNPLATGRPDIISKELYIKEKAMIHPTGIEIKAASGERINKHKNKYVSNVDNISGFKWYSHHGDVPHCICIAWDWFDYSPIITLALIAETNPAYWLTEKGFYRLNQTTKTHDNKIACQISSNAQHRLVMEDGIALIIKDERIQKRYGELLTTKKYNPRFDEWWLIYQNNIPPIPVNPFFD